MPKRILWDQKNIRTRIVDKYFTIIEEFLQQIEKILLPIGDININTCMYVGVNSLYRVFEYVLFKTKNIEKAYYYCQKTYFYYTEYMEQIHQSNLQNSLNQTDAVLFIYKKTIFELEKDGDSKTFDTITNIMTFEEEISRLNNKDYLLWLQKISDLINIFFYWENTFISFHERMDLCKSLLKKYMYNVDSLELGIDYINIIQEKVQMDYSCYYDLLNEIYEYNNTHNVTIDKQTKNDIFLFKFHINKSIVQENIKTKNIKYLIKWLHEPSVM
jgi:hypothetical protein